LILPDFQGGKGVTCVFLEIASKRSLSFHLLFCDLRYLKALAGHQDGASFAKVHGVI
jgi:hypothetical protein